MGKIQWDYKIDDEDKKVEKEIKKIIKDNNEAAIKILQEFDVRRKVMKKFYKDCKKKLGIKKDDDCDNIEIKDSDKPIDQKRKKYIIQYRENIGKDNVIAKTALGKKWADGFDYDYDASNCSTYIYCRTVFKGEKKTISKQGKNKKSPYCRVIHCKKYPFRGDTMNSWYTTLIEFFRLFDGGKDGYLKI